MSKAIYEDIQQFLSEAWGPVGGWYQAVVFAADLKPQAAKSGTSTPKVEPQDSGKDTNLPKTDSSARTKRRAKPELADTDKPERPKRTRVTRRAK
jgi:N-glycosylase/DNA lyase